MTTRLQTPRLTIRSVSIDDHAALCQVLTDPIAMRYIGDGTPRTPGEIRERLEAAIERERTTGMAFWTVELRTPDEPTGAPAGTIIGDCGIIPVARIGPEIELGYRLNRRFWNRGYATEAARAALAHAFTAFDLERIIAVTIPENYPSQHVLSKCGLRRVGLTDRYYDTTTMLFEITRDEWRNTEPRAPSPRPPTH